MSIGVATANSILLVTFANELRERGVDPLEAAVTEGYTRLRPIIMTACAMIIGMLPMALGIGEGGEQNAPLARAVIGGLMTSTLLTLFVVPVMYTILDDAGSWVLARLTGSAPRPARQPREAGTIPVAATGD